jgi:hypothetical protein
LVAKRTGVSAFRLRSRFFATLSVTFLRSTEARNNTSIPLPPSVVRCSASGAVSVLAVGDEIEHLIAHNSVKIAAVVRSLTIHPLYSVHLIAWAGGQYRMKVDRLMFQSE